MSRFDLPTWLLLRANEEVKIPATVWQQLNYGVFDWAKDRSDKRALFLKTVWRCRPPDMYESAFSSGTNDLAPRPKIGAEIEALYLGFTHAPFKK
jgi:hypothetical protein